MTASQSPLDFSEELSDDTMKEEDLKPKENSFVNSPRLSGKITADEMMKHTWRPILTSIDEDPSDSNLKEADKICAPRLTGKLAVDQTSESNSASMITMKLLQPSIRLGEWPNRGTIPLFIFALVDPCAPMRLLPNLSENFENLEELLRSQGKERGDYADMSKNLFLGTASKFLCKSHQISFDQAAPMEFQVLDNKKRPKYVRDKRENDFYWGLVRALIDSTAPIRLRIDYTELEAQKNFSRLSWTLTQQQESLVLDNIQKACTGSFTVFRDPPDFKAGEVKVIARFSLLAQVMRVSAVRFGDFPGETRIFTRYIIDGRNVVKDMQYSGKFNGKRQLRSVTSDGGATWSASLVEDAQDGFDSDNRHDEAQSEDIPTEEELSTEEETTKSDLDFIDDSETAK